MLGGFASQPTITKDQRTLIGAAVGFLLGLAGLLIFEFLNARIRDVSGTEAAGMPLVAEIPALKMSRADRFACSPQRIGLAHGRGLSKFAHVDHRHVATPPAGPRPGER